jgi:hypothetical protein
MTKVRPLKRVRALLYFTAAVTQSLAGVMRDCEDGVKGEQWAL